MMLDLRAHSGPAVTVRSTLLGQRAVVMARVDADDGAPSLTSADGATLAEAINSALAQRLPFVLVIQTSGVVNDEGIAPSAAWGTAAKSLARASGVIPTLAVAAGPVVSGPSLLLGLVDLVAFTEGSYAYVTGPKSVESYTGVPVTADDLGGLGAHLRSTGVAALAAADLEDALAQLADVLAYLPHSVDAVPEFIPTADPIDRDTSEAGDFLPSGAQGSYDVRQIIATLADDGEFLELRAAWAPNMVTGFCSFGGIPTGVVANQTQALAGSIDIPASQKGARFVAMCDAFNLPLLTLVDTSGFLPGKDLEWRGMIRHGAQMAFAYARATVPRIGLILRKSYGGAYIVMDSKNMGNDLMLAWPSAEVAVMGAKGAVEILHRKATEEERAQRQAEYEATYLTPYPAAERQSINQVISPADTRRIICSNLSMLATKKERVPSRRHDNTPL